MGGDKGRREGGKEGVEAQQDTARPFLLSELVFYPLKMKDASSSKISSYLVFPVDLLQKYPSSQRKLAQKKKSEASRLSLCRFFSCLLPRSEIRNRRRYGLLRVS